MIDRCICHEVRFEEALEVAKDRGADTLEELREEITVCQSCQMCRPYLVEMLETQQTEFKT